MRPQILLAVVAMASTVAGRPQHEKEGVTWDDRVAATRHLWQDLKKGAKENYNGYEGGMKEFIEKRGEAVHETYGLNKNLSTEISKQAAQFINMHNVFKFSGHIFDAVANGSKAFFTELLSTPTSKATWKAWHDTLREAGVSQEIIQQSVEDRKLILARLQVEEIKMAKEEESGAWIMLLREHPHELTFMWMRLLEPLDMTLEDKIQLIYKGSEFYKNNWGEQVAKHDAIWDGITEHVNKAKNGMIEGLSLFGLTYEHCKDNLDDLSSYSNFIIENGKSGNITLMNALIGFGRMINYFKETYEAAFYDGTIFDMPLLRKKDQEAWKVYKKDLFTDEQIMKTEQKWLNDMYTAAHELRKNILPKVELNVNAEIKESVENLYHLEWMNHDTHDFNDLLEKMSAILRNSSETQNVWRKSVLRGLENKPNGGYLVFIGEEAWNQYEGHPSMVRVFDNFFFSGKTADKVLRTPLFNEYSKEVLRLLSKSVSKETVDTVKQEFNKIINEALEDEVNEPKEAVRLAFSEMTLFVLQSLSNSGADKIYRKMREFTEIMKTFLMQLLDQNENLWEYFTNEIESSRKMINEFSGGDEEYDQVFEKLEELLEQLRALYDGQVITMTLVFDGADLMKKKTQEIFSALWNNPESIDDSFVQRGKESLMKTWDEWKSINGIRTGTKEHSKHVSIVRMRQEQYARQVFRAMLKEIFSGGKSFSEIADSEEATASFQEWIEFLKRSGVPRQIIEEYKRKKKMIWRRAKEYEVKGKPTARLMEIALHKLEHYLGEKLKESGLSQEAIQKIWHWGHRHHVTFWTDFMDEHEDLWEFLGNQHKKWKRVVAKDLKKNGVPDSEQVKFLDALDKLFLMVKENIENKTIKFSDLIGGLRELNQLMADQVHTLFEERSRPTVEKLEAARNNILNLWKKWFQDQAAKARAAGAN